MTSKLKCPICGEILQKYGEIDPNAGTSIVLGANCPKCGIGNSDIKLWQELIHTKKQLDRAKWWLKEIVENHRYTPITTAEMALKELDVVEQLIKGE